MYVNQLTNETYIDRKEAKISLGTSNFNRLLKKRRLFILSTDNHLPTMGYRIIPASLAIGLTTNEAYTYFLFISEIRLQHLYFTRKSLKRYPN